MDITGNIPEANELSRDPIFAALRASGRREVLLRAHRRSFNSGEIIFDEDKLADGIYFLASGTVRLTRRAFGHTSVIGTEHAPSTLLTIGLLDEGRNGVTAVASAQCTVCVLGRDAYLRVCMTHPESALSLLRLCTRRVRQLVSLADILALTTVRQRVARWLLEMSEATGGPAFHMPLSQEQVAARLGTVREVLFRNLRDLQCDGIIHFRRRELVIDKLPELQAIAGIMSPDRILVASKDRAAEPLLITTLEC